MNLWLLNNVLSLFAASSNKYLAPDGVPLAVIDLGIGAGILSAILIGGYLFDNYGGLYIFYMSPGFTVSMVVAPFPLPMLAHVAVKRRQALQGVVQDSHGQDTKERMPLIN